jgi:hypothetical protein
VAQSRGPGWHRPLPQCRHPGSMPPKVAHARFVGWRRAPPLRPPRSGHRP